MLLSSLSHHQMCGAVRTTANEASESSVTTEQVSTKTNHTHTSKMQVVHDRRTAAPRVRVRTPALPFDPQ